MHRFGPLVMLTFFGHTALSWVGLRAARAGQHSGFVWPLVAGQRSSSAPPGRLRDSERFEFCMSSAGPAALTFCALVLSFKRPLGTFAPQRSVAASLGEDGWPRCSGSATNNGHAVLKHCRYADRMLAPPCTRLHAPRAPHSCPTSQLPTTWIACA